MSAVTTPTNVSLIQRDASGDNQFIDLLGTANTNKAIGFNGSGVMSALATPLLTAANTFTADQTVQGKLTTRSLVGTVVSVAASAIDWAAGSSFSKTLSANTTFTFANTTSGQSITVAVTNTASNYAVTWPGGIKWPGGLNPTQSTGVQTDVYTFKNIGGVFYGSIDRGVLPVQHVQTWAQLQAALAAVGAANGGVIYIDGVIEIEPYSAGSWNDGGITLNKPNVVLTGPSNGKSVLKLKAGVNYNAFNNNTINILNSNIVIENITIEGVTTLFRPTGSTAEYLPNTPYGIHIARGANSSGVADNSGVSNITIRNVTFRELSRAIAVTGGSATADGIAPFYGATATIKNLSILNNKVRNCGGGFEISWGADDLLIDGNSIIGDGAIFDKLKFSYYNAIWVGEGISNIRIVNNYCANHQRIGIEVFIPFANRSNLAQKRHPVSYGQNDVGFVVANNTVKTMGSMGISFTGARNSVVANNTISDCGDIGLEIVGDDKNVNSQRPDLVVNVLCVGNTIKNVYGFARRPNPITPTTADYGYSAIPLNPNSAVVTTSLSNKVALVGQTAFSIGTKTFTFNSPPKTYPEFAAGKEIQLKLAVDANYIMTGTVDFNDGTTIVITIPAGGLNTLTLPGPYDVLLCPYGLHALTLVPSQLEWAANEGLVNNIPVAGTEIGTFLTIQSSVGSSERSIYFLATLRTYVLGASTCTVYITGSGPGACNQKTTWWAGTNRSCAGMTIDKIDGAKVIGNTIDTVLDSNSSQRFGCQIISSKNVIFENNLITRGGNRYLQVNISNSVIVRNNVFRSGETAMVRDAARAITILGEDITWPEDYLNNSSIAAPSGFYAIYSPLSVDYNASVPYNNCRYIVKDNTFIPRVNPIRPYVNGAAIFSDQFSRPETQFNGAIDLKHNTFTDGYDVTVDFPSPVLDYSQKWNNSSSTEAFIGYRFHADPAISPAASRIFDVASIDETYLYLRRYTSVTSHNISAGEKTFTISSPAAPTYQYPALSTFQLAAIPQGTFVRCVSGTLPTGPNFIEGRVKTAVPVGSTSFIIEVTNTGGSGTGLNSWNIVFDGSVLFIDKASKLNLRSDVVLDYHTGTKIGTAATQKIGFWNTMPVVQPAAVADATDAGTTQTQLNALLSRLRAAGIIASS
jgi:parallel beta-helix repeat protein